MYVCLYFVADFGDFTQFMSQDFLREYVLFPVVSPQTFTVQICVCVCVAVCLCVSPEGTHSCVTCEPPPSAYLTDRQKTEKE